MGCTNCSSKGGCSTRKNNERELLASLLPRLYPTGTWGELDAHAAHHQGLTTRGLSQLARKLTMATRAPVHVRPGEADSLCDYIYLLCVGRAPGLCELRDGTAALSTELEAPMSERYLRVAVSQVAPVALLQEVVLESEPDEAGLWISERPRPGVFEPVLLPRTQKTVDCLVEHGLTFLDFGVIDRPPEGYAPGAWADRFGGEPDTVNYLFFSEPSSTVSSVLVPAAAA